MPKLKDKQKTFSIAIPVYEMHGRGVEFLSFSFAILSKQSFKDFEILISDDSQNNEIRNLCQEWCDKLTINYCKNTKNPKGLTSNVNNALKNCTGKWIKILFQDDFLYGNNALENLHNHIKNNPNKVWFATAYANSHSVNDYKIGKKNYAKYSKGIHLTGNTIGMPSVITIKNSPEKLLFDPRFNWLMDIDFYKRMYDLYGEPCYFNNSINVITRIWNNNTSFNLSDKEKNHDAKLILRKYFPISLDNPNKDLSHQIDLFADNKITTLKDLDIVYQHLNPDKLPETAHDFRRYIRNNITLIKYDFHKISLILLIYFMRYKIKIWFK